ncbi:CehA/McbA family metallohydrolase [Paenibacillus thalictri]|uniref:CehA/McbA family metallohydrolase n=1 Tax=Paenibacillus thalictri TaxID=2527873 RepID=A0A4Q9DY87_9BACL|nr:CehA/McbA family metallohydrolase [Paenibacillus thalictri]TBL81060.1 hypothetical protein EYB31_02910 [Paenibacillus thalictri]
MTIRKIPINLRSVYNKNIAALTVDDCSQTVVANRHHLLTGEQELWGIPFLLGPDGGAAEKSDAAASPGSEPTSPAVPSVAADPANVILLKDADVHIPLPGGVHDRQLVFVHAADFKESPAQPDGMTSPMLGTPRLGEVVCTYVLNYDDGTRVEVPIRRRYEISEFNTAWGENSFEAVKHLKPFAIPDKSLEREGMASYPWGKTQIATTFQGEGSPMHHWLYALENPYPQKLLIALTLHPVDGAAFIFGITGANASSHPLRWGERKKLKLKSAAALNHYGKEADIYIDMGAVISVTPMLRYDNERWCGASRDPQPVPSADEWIVEYTAHPDACLHVRGARPVSLPIREWERRGEAEFGESQTLPVRLRVLEKSTNKPVAAKVHIHGRWGEYVAPVNGHRQPNPRWFEDYGAEHVNGFHYSVYINGEADYKLPRGEVFLEVTKGLEITPIRKRIVIDEHTSEIIVELERVLPWRQKGWVTADTHVHFLSPQTALLEGEAEGVNVVNLLTSQWGEMFSNIGDFDGKTTIGSVQNGGTGEYLVRVGTENRQHILGHISLLGYEGSMILPLCTGGPDESALGDPLEATITQWARMCREKFGLAVLPHLPNPRAEGAASIVLGEIDAVEICSFEVSGISPYSLSDWYRYLNCGYQVPAVAGTDKMSQSTAVGTIRTYSLIRGEPFTYESWMRSVRKGLTFVTYGPLMDFTVNGCEAGATIEMAASGGTVDVVWHAASVTVPITRIELVVNGEQRECKTADGEQPSCAGAWTVNVSESCWIALRIRGAYPGQAEIITAHSSAVFVKVDGKPAFRAADAVTILEQIEGSTAYIKTLATRADERIFKQLLDTLHSAHSALHRRMHERHIYHRHATHEHHRH